MRSRPFRILSAAALAASVVLVPACAGGHRRLRTEAPAPAAADSSSIKRNQLAARLDSLLADTLLARAQYGVYIVDAWTGQPVFARNFQQLLVPASANKLFTTALALRRLGPHHRFATEAIGDSIGTGGRLNGDLYLKGSGDPSLTTDGLEELAFRLRAAGLERVAGQLVIDPSTFDTTKYGPGWMWDEGPYAYNAPISALSVNRNTFETGVTAGPRPGSKLKVSIRPASGYFKIDNQGVTAFPGVKRSLRVSRRKEDSGETVSVSGALPQEESPYFVVRSVADPSGYCGRLFLEALRRQGVTVGRGVAVGRTPERLAVLAAVGSSPLYAILQDMNKDSDNFTAEMLFRSASAGRPPTENGAPADSGPMVAMMAGLGFEPGSYRIVDGSGLSRYNLCSPQELVAVLMDLHQDELVRPELLASLPIAGADGTLGSRMSQEGVQYRARAKTGTMTGVSSLAGFAYGSGGKCYCFAMMFNNYTAGASSVRALQDRMISEIISLSP